MDGPCLVRCYTSWWYMSRSYYSQSSSPWADHKSPCVSAISCVTIFTNLCQSVCCQHPMVPTMQWQIQWCHRYLLPFWLPEPHPLEPKWDATFGIQRTAPPDMDGTFCWFNSDPSLWDISRSCTGIATLLGLCPTPPMHAFMEDIQANQQIYTISIPDTYFTTM
jgi:hypothetical protein